MQVFTDTVPSDLAELWNVKSAQQKAVLRLCAAVRAANADALKVCRDTSLAKWAHPSCDSF